MKLVHLALNFGQTLCGKQSNNYQFVETYLKYPSLNDDYYYFFYDKGTCKWCPDCIIHPEPDKCMTLVHLKYSFGYNKPTLCGNKSDSYEFAETYLKYPNFADFPYSSNLNRKWCPDCITHPDLVMAVLNGTNV